MLSVVGVKHSLTLHSGVRLSRDNSQERKPSMSQSEAALKKILRVVGISEQEFAMKTSLQEIEGWDSLMFMQVIAILETSGGSQLSDDDILSLTPTVILQKLSSGKG